MSQPRFSFVTVPEYHMPIYAYQCAVCGHDFDRLQRLADPDPDTCPACGAVGGVKRQLTAPSFRLAGSGWYETDFKKDGDKKRNLADAGGKDGGGGGDAPAAAASGAGDGKPSSAGDGGKKGDKASAPPGSAVPAAASPAKAPTPAPKSDSKPSPKD